MCGAIFMLSLYIYWQQKLAEKATSKLARRFDLCLHFLGAVSEHHKSDHIECFHLCTQSSSVSALKPADFFTMQMIHLLLQKRNHLWSQTALIKVKHTQQTHDWLQINYDTMQCNHQPIQTHLYTCTCKKETAVTMRKLETIKVWKIVTTT